MRGKTLLVLLAACGAGGAEVKQAREASYRGSLEEIQKTAQSVLAQRFPGRMQTSSDGQRMVSCGSYTEASEPEPGAGAAADESGRGARGPGGAMQPGITTGAACIQVALVGADQSWTVQVSSHGENYQLPAAGAAAADAKADWRQSAALDHKVSEIQAAIHEELKDRVIAPPK